MDSVFQGRQGILVRITLRGRGETVVTWQLIFDCSGLDFLRLAYNDRRRDHELFIVRKVYQKFQANH